MFPKHVIILNVITDDCSLLQTPEPDVIINEGWLGGLKRQVQNAVIAADPLFIDLTVDFKSNKGNKARSTKSLAGNNYSFK